MFDRNDKSAFTLVETMVASSIAVIVLGATVGTMVFCQRMIRQTMAEAESSLALREIRDKLLFHAGVKNDGSRLDDGLLTGKWEATGDSLKVNWSDLDSNGKIIIISDAIKIKLSSDEKGNYFYNENGPDTETNDKWFRPGNFRIGDDWSAVWVPPVIKITLLDPLIGNVLNTTHIHLPKELNMDKGE